MILKEYKVFPRLKDSEDFPETLVYSRRYGGYFLSTSSKLIKLIEVTHEAYMRFRANEVTHIFPEYDENKHEVTALTYEETAIKMDVVPMGLNELQIAANLPYGCFMFEETNNGTMLKKVNFSSDNYINLNHRFDLYKDFTEFRNVKKAIMKSKGQRGRKGVLFYGPPGNGKTTQISHLAKNAEKDKFRVFFIDKGCRLTNLIDFKRLLEKEDSVFIIEELTERADGRAGEELLSFTDGEMSWDNSYLIATTNNPEELPWNVVDRPSRFKVKLEFPNPTPDERKSYLRALGVDEEKVEEACKATEGFSLDYLKNVVMDSFIEEKDIPTILADYKNDKEKVYNKFKKSKLGL